MLTIFPFSKTFEGVTKMSNVKPLVIPMVNPSVTYKELRGEEAWSYSRLSLYERCQRAFYYKYVEQRPSPAGVPAKVGKIIHRGSEWSLKEGYKTSDAIRFALYEHDGIPDGETFGSLLKMLENALYHIPINEHLKAEVHLKVATKLGTIQGIIDVIIDDLFNDHIEIIDLKTSWQESKAADSKQLLFYAWLVKEIRGTAFTGNITAKLVYPRINKVSEVVITEPDTAAIKEWFIKLTSEINIKPTEKEQWPMTSGKSACEHCPFAGLCAGEFTGKFPNSGDFKDVEEAAAAGEFILQQEALIKNLKKALKKYITDGNVIKIGDAEWYISESESKPKVIDNRKWIEFLEETGLDVADYLTADNTKINELLAADDSGQIHQLIDYTTPRKTLTFGVKAIPKHQNGDKQQDALIEEGGKGHENS